MFVSGLFLIRNHARRHLLKYHESLTARFKRRQYTGLIVLGSIRHHANALRVRRGIRTLSHSALFGESI